VLFSCKLLVTLHQWFSTFFGPWTIEKKSDGPLCYADTSRTTSRNFSGSFDQGFMKLSVDHQNFQVDHCLLKSIYSLVSSTYGKLVESQVISMSTNMQRSLYLLLAPFIYIFLVWCWSYQTFSLFLGRGADEQVATSSCGYACVNQGSC